MAAVVPLAQSGRWKTAQIMDELVRLAKEMRDDNERHNQLGLGVSAAAFDDAIKGPTPHREMRLPADSLGEGGGTGVQRAELFADASMGHTGGS
ncbi:MAG: hypothetical protein M0Z29_00640 [Actinomycetota bacterium]|nr:hypothetical protein [Actinomycetota bacterium]